MGKYIWLLIILITLSTCSQKELNSNYDYVKMSEAFENIKAIYLSQIVDSIQYIPLETGPHSMLNWKTEFAITDSFIIARNYGTPPLLMLFNRNTGKLISEIGKKGRGPSEYENPEKAFFNPFNNNIYTSTNSYQNILILTLGGKYIEEFKKPQYSEPSLKTDFIFCQIEAFLDSNTFVCGVLNTNGHIKKKLILFDKNGIINIYPNFLSWGHNDPLENIKNFKYSTSWPGAKIYYTYNNLLFFKELFNDTLFMVSEEKLTPKYIFDLGKFGVNYRYQDKQLVQSSLPYYKEYFMINDIDETKDFLFVRFEYHGRFYLGYYEKELRKFYVCKDDENGKSAIKDDLNDFISLIPKQLTTKNELISTIDPREIINWRNKNQDKAHKLQNKFPWLNKIGELDNQILVVAKCK